MKFSEQWLREWVNPSVSTEELVHQLTMAGLEVDAVEPVAPEFQGVVIGRVARVEPHPDADKLRICQVDVGAEAALSIVCGAPNVYEGMHAPTAVVGATLPGDFRIKKAKLRGVESFGMLCSAKELGLSEASEGLMDLPSHSPVGQDIRDYLGLDDATIELGLTPNRSDCLGVAGIAREVGVLHGLEVTGPPMEPVVPATDATFPVVLEAPADCPRYVGRVLRGVDPTRETPMWMKERLRRSGLRSLGPLVDVTNYVLLELGQPMHAFDLAKLSGSIRVRHASGAEKLLLLNGDEVTPEADTLLIVDDSGPLALAGIMGGEPSSVGDETTDIFLESAFFTPECLAGRARRYGLHTDSSHRFERGVSPDLQRRAMERATALLLDIVGGEAGPVIEVAAEEHLPKRNPIRLRAARVGRVLGAQVDPARIEAILTGLGMSVVAAAGEWQVTAPPFRFDIGIEEDLIEEIGRIVGYSSLPSTLPVGTLTMLSRPEAHTSLRRFKAALVDLGYQEAITYSFVDPKIHSLLDPARQPVALANPISADMSVMRTTLWPGLVQALLHNVNRQQGRVRLFEAGLRFVPEAGEVRQELVLAGIAFGPALPEQWATGTRMVDFFDLKGDLESIVALTGRQGELIFSPEENPVLHPGQSASVSLGGEPIGWIGALHPGVEKALGVPGKVFVFEVRLDALQRGRLPTFAELSKFPAIRRDIAIVVDRGLPAERIMAAIRANAPETLQNLKLFDVYAGERIDPSRKSVAVGLTLQAQSRTLKDEEVDAAIKNIVESLKTEFGATLRD